MSTPLFAGGRMWLRRRCENLMGGPEAIATGRQIRRTDWSDREAVLAVVQQSRVWCAPKPPLGYASAEVQADREVVLASVKRFGPALRYASTELQADREVVLAAVKKQGYVLEYYASTEMLSDREIVLAAMQNDCAGAHVLPYVSAELQADREVVLAAVKLHGEALRYASSVMKADRGVVMAAIMQTPEAFWYASAALKRDRKVKRLRNMRLYTRCIQSAWKRHANEVALHPEVAHTGISMYGERPTGPNPCHYDTA